MTGTEILNFIAPDMLILIPVLIVLGIMLKAIPNIKDWTIPIIIGAIGISFAILVTGFNNGFTAQNVLTGLLQGILCAGMAVYVHQLTIQSTKKRLTDKNKEQPQYKVID